MRLVVNGEPRDVRDGATLEDLVRELGLERRPIAVERNRRVVPRDRYAATRLEDGDRLEIVGLVGGG
ncbi:MAG TPA: sulfur carrier protein ThiS [Planctomycetota bacterium]|jgi:sulfur carrier protein|nr:sulfur carrier protein ThiS [Planctomycetota bacterium]